MVCGVWRGVWCVVYRVLRAFWRPAQVSVCCEPGDYVTVLQRNRFWWNACCGVEERVVSGNRSVSLPAGQCYWSHEERGKRHQGGTGSGQRPVWLG